MKKRIFAVAAAFCLLAGSSAIAQEQSIRKEQAPRQRPTVEQVAQHRTERMTRELGLDQAQAKKVYAIALKQQQQLEALREQMRKERQAEAEAMKSILTTEQYDKWVQMQGPRPGEHRGKMQAGKCPNRDKACCQKKQNCPTKERKCDGSKR